MNTEKQRRLEKLNAEKEFIEQQIDLLEKQIDVYNARLDDITWARLGLEDSNDEEDE